MLPIAKNGVPCPPDPSRFNPSYECVEENALFDQLAKLPLNLLSSSLPESSKLYNLKQCLPTYSKYIDFIEKAADPKLLQNFLFNNADRTVFLSKLGTIILLANRTLYFNANFVYVGKKTIHNSFKLIPMVSLFQMGNSRRVIYVRDKLLGNGKFKRVNHFTPLSLGMSDIALSKSFESIEHVLKEHRIMLLLHKLQSPHLATNLYSGAYTVQSKKTDSETDRLLDKHITFLKLYEGTSEFVQQEIFMKRILDLVAPLMKAIQLMHQAGVVHRDIKPLNILHLNGMLALADFGCGSTLGKKSSFSKCYGLPPEIKPDIEFTNTAAIDYWRLGLTIIYYIIPQKPNQRYLDWGILIKMKSQTDIDAHFDKLKMKIIALPYDPTDEDHKIRLNALEFAKHLIQLDPLKRSLRLDLLETQVTQCPPPLPMPIFDSPPLPTPVPLSGSQAQKRDGDTVGLRRSERKRAARGTT